jgi:hypothetical protein
MGWHFEASLIYGAVIHEDNANFVLPHNTSEDFYVDENLWEWSDNDGNWHCTAYPSLTIKNFADGEHGSFSEFVVFDIEYHTSYYDTVTPVDKLDSTSGDHSALEVFCKQYSIGKPGWHLCKEIV